MSRTSSKFGQIQPWTAELAALDQLKKIFYLLENFSKYFDELLLSGERCPLGYLFLLQIVINADLNR